MPLGPSPNPGLLDPLGIFTNGEFTSYASSDPALLLYTHGALSLGSSPGEVPSTVAPTTGRSYWRQSFSREGTSAEDDEQAIAVLLMSLVEEDDDWW